MNPEEKAEECWRPIQTVESILVSVCSMLSDPNFSSPANVDASVR
jgi:ubiquitin-conjugating enzyme E2 R